MNAIHAANDHSLASVVLDALKDGGLAPDRLDEARVFCQAFFARIAGGDNELHTPGEWAVLVSGLLDFVQQRQPGHALVRVINPEHGHAGRSLLQVITDDMPFLIDTTSMVVAETLQIHAVIHPVITVSRDSTGKLLRMTDEAGNSGAFRPESVMHFEIDRVADEAAQVQLKGHVEAALDDARAVVGDWSAMRDMALAIATDLPQRNLPLDPASIREASEFLRWIADDNFTFFGYREYEVTDADGEQVLRSMDATGLGLLH